MASSYQARLANLQRLLRQRNPPLYPSVSLLQFEDGKYQLSCGLWSWKNGDRMRTIDAEYDTPEAARQAYQEFLSKYPPAKEHSPVFLDMVLLTAE
ncbi:MAG: hypothetical protein ACI3WQ_04545 [Faecousia sp.]